MQAFLPQEKHGGDKGENGNEVENQRMFHEGNILLDAEKLHGGSCT
jgi:hypothetical protein